MSGRDVEGGRYTDYFDEEVREATVTGTSVRVCKGELFRRDEGV